MLVFHEGLPGSGKSYGALFEHVIPAIKKRRRVVARLNGLDNESCLSAISNVTGVPLDVVQSLIEFLPKEPLSVVQDIGKRLNELEGALVIIDEIRKYFPSTRAPLSDHATTFVGEHRHKGIDIIAIDQSMNDVHHLYRRRVDRLVKYTKLDYVGFPNVYRWVMLRGVPSDKGDVKFQRVNSGFRKYRPEYYACYKSFSMEEGQEYEQYGDAKGNVFKSSRVRFALFGAILFFAVGFYFLRSFFNADANSMVQTSKVLQSQIVKKDERQVLVSPGPVVTPHMTDVRRKVEKTKEELELERIEREKQERAKKQSEEYIHKLASSYRVHLSAYMHNERGVRYVVEFVDGTYRVRERLNDEQMSALGWQSSFDVRTGILKLKSLEFGDELIVTAWPMDGAGGGRVGERVINTLRDNPVGLPRVELPARIAISRP